MAIIRKYECPDFLREVLSQENYDIWLSRKASTHLKRDRSRGNKLATREQYKLAIHQAVTNSQGLDAYTGKRLRWDLVKVYNNSDSKKEGRQYKAKFSELPTVDHIGDGKGIPDFKICSWKVNDAKNDLSLEEFLSLCEMVLQFNMKRGGTYKFPTNSL